MNEEATERASPSSPVSRMCHRQPLKHAVALAHLDIALLPCTAIEDCASIASACLEGVARRYCLGPRGQSDGQTGFAAQAWPGLSVGS